MNIRSESGIADRLAGSRDAFTDSRIPRMLVVLFLAVAIGATAAINPLLAGAVVGLSIVALGLAGVASRITDIFLGTLAVLLVGYAFLGRGFAYVGVPPLYVGEIGLVLGVIAFIGGRRYGPLQPSHVLLVMFVAWGAIRTVPYLSTYGIDALRDAVTWAYALFAIIVSVVLSPRHLRAGIRIYGRAIPVYLVWVPIATALILVNASPTVPGTDVPLISPKGGDIGVQLAGIAAFVLVGLYSAGRGRRVPETVIWMMWLVSFAIVGILNRGGLLAASVGATALLYVRTAGRILTVIYLAFAMLTVVVTIDPKIDTGGRVISVGQMVENVTSLLGASNDGDLEGTKEFRLRWWNTIIGYTVGGQYFWTGKGYGVNLADDDGFQVTADGSLRAPHNGHIEVLARSGVPGFVLWILLQVVFAVSLLRSVARARWRKDTLAVQLLGFVSVIWLAGLVNAMFDPYLQGPQGGIWYWTMFGVGIAVIRMADQGELMGEVDEDAPVADRGRDPDRAAT